MSPYQNKRVRFTGEQNMKKSTLDKQRQFAYTRKCLLHKIKKCNKIIYTNRINQRFCCDDHRYQWHNSMKALFRRVSILEETLKIGTESFNNLAYAFARACNKPLSTIEMFMKEKK